MARFIMFSLILCIFAPSIMAAEINEEGAQRLKTLLSGYIQEQKEIFADNPSGTLVIEGDVSVEQADTYYAVTLPNLKLQAADGGRVDFGMISINATPDDTSDDRWKMAIALPTPVMMYDEMGAIVAEINIKGQRAAGIWDESLKTFVKYDALYTDISVDSKDAEEKFAFNIPQVIARYDFREGGENLLTGNGYVLTKGLNFAASEDNAKGTVGEFKLAFETDSFDVVKFKESQKRFQALTQGMTTEGVDDKAVEKEALQALMDVYHSFGEKMKVVYSFEDFKASGTSKQTGNIETVALDDAKFGLDIGGFQSDSVFFGLMFGYNGLEISDSSVPKDIMPADTNLDISLRNIPMKDLTSIGQNAAQSIADNPQAKSMVGMSLMMRLPAILSQAGTKAVIDNTYIGNNDYRFTMDGNVMSDIKAVTGDVANVNATFKGLETLLKRVQYYRETAEDGKSQSYDNLINQLTLLKQIGQKSGDTYKYDFELTPSGEMTINGENAQAVMQSAQQ